MRFHILGTGAIASQLRPHHEHWHDFESRKRTIKYERSGKTTLVPDFEATVAEDIGATSDIDALVVSTKAHHTVDALRPIVPRLKESSTIILLQNGMGTAEKVIHTLWPKTSPRIMLGVNRHAVHRKAPFEIAHYSGWNDHEALVLGYYPTSNKQTSSEVENSFTSIPDLSAAVYPWEEIQRRMLKKLIINASINPVATLLDAKNGALIYDNPFAESLMRKLCQEATMVFGKDLPGETFESLFDSVCSISRLAAENVCSTLQDIRAGRLTEVDYINGYICKRGQERGIPTPTHQAFVELVHAKECVLGL
ncbi:2-dehydropantoate 2-reductase [Radiomyces spectabilis]|uniref:2-dehydropantoate 2-reductase n=1 Tax=Radiomyces spectabilis TaxID=64574 RepID=UPI002220AF7C|nr:2-dehydropantoate 2-reductase [Radiomyces spectabilis]KAI8390918.1 2-dehydropantoate 2-reductase [Radiomyces spectabilis]